jgi:hypothetical protein
MSYCRRNGVTYKRHEVKDGRCVKCGAIAVPTEKRDEILRAAAAKVISQLVSK